MLHPRSLAGFVREPRYRRQQQEMKMNFRVDISQDLSRKNALEAYRISILPAEPEDDLTDDRFVQQGPVFNNQHSCFGVFESLEKAAERALQFTNITGLKVVEIARPLDTPEYIVTKRDDKKARGRVIAFN